MFTLGDIIETFGFLFRLGVILLRQLVFLFRLGDIIETIVFLDMVIFILRPLVFVLV